MHVLVIGAAGMVGRKLIERLARAGRLGERTIAHLTAADVVEPEVVAACRGCPFPLKPAVGDFSEPGEAEKLVAVRHVGGGYAPRLVFTSSLAVFGAPFPDAIGDEFLTAPLTSYGTQKAIGELLLSDYSRRGFFDGVGIRLPTI